MRQLEEQIRVLVEESSARKRKRVPANPASQITAGSLPVQTATGGSDVPASTVLLIMLISPSPLSQVLALVKVGSRNAAKVVQRLLY